jgi:hypothetical protein
MNFLRTRFEFQNEIYTEKNQFNMILYFNNKKGEESNIFLDFHTICDRVEHRIPETTLYRLLQRRCKRSYRYRNRDLYPYRDLLEIPELANDLKIKDTDE